ATGGGGITRLSSIAEPGGRTVSSSNFVVGAELPWLLDADGATRATFTYDGGKRMTNAQLGPLNYQTGNLSATFTYDGTNERLTTADLGLGSTMTLTAAAVQGLATTPAKNAGDAVAVVTDALSQKTTYTLDSLGRMTQLQTPDGATQSL